jgi:hypothetical protein
MQVLEVVVFFSPGFPFLDAVIQASYFLYNFSLNQPWPLLFSLSGIVFHAFLPGEFWFG